MLEFQTFGSFSNFQLNISKTEALNISLPQSTVSQLTSNFPFQWQTHGISYLGTTIPSDLSDLYSLIYSPLLSRIGKLGVPPTPLPWFRRINMLKMDVLPKLLYFFQTIPILVQRSFFCTLFLSYPLYLELQIFSFAP